MAVFWSRKNPLAEMQCKANKKRDNLSVLIQKMCCAQNVFKRVNACQYCHGSPV